MKIKLFIILAILPLIISAQSENYAKAAVDFRLVNQAYYNTAALSMNVNYTLFPGYTSTTPFDRSNGTYMKSGNATYSNLLGIISLSNSKATVTLDSNEQTIVVSDPMKDNFDPKMIELDTMLKLCSSIEYKELDGIRYYKLRFDKLLISEYNAIEVYIDSKTNLLSRLTLFFRIEMDLDEEGSEYSTDKPRLEIVYTNVNTNPVFNKDQFSETKYVAMQGGNVSAAPAYSKFKVINNKIK